MKTTSPQIRYGTVSFKSITLHAKVVIFYFPSFFTPKPEVEGQKYSSLFSFIRKPHSSKMAPLPDNVSDDASWQSENSYAKSHDEDGQSSTDLMPEKDDGEKELQIATKETKAVLGLRVVVLLVLMAAGVAVCLTVYYVSFNSVSDKYDALYYGAANRVVEAFMDIADSKLGALTSLGVALSAHGSDFSSDWPFVALSSFQQRASTALKQSGALLISLVPEVTDGERNEWENFAVEGSAWM